MADAKKKAKKAKKAPAARRNGAEPARKRVDRSKVKIMRGYRL